MIRLGVFTDNDNRLKELVLSPGAIQEFELISQNKKLLLEVATEHLSNIVTNYEGVADDSDFQWKHLNNVLSKYKNIAVM